MKKIYLIVCLLSYFSFSSLAQVDSSVIVLGTTGKIKYKNGKTCIKNLEQGDLLDRKGTVTLPAGANLLMLSNGQWQECTTTGENKLSNLFSNVMQIRSLNFEAWFGQFMLANINTVSYISNNKLSKKFKGDGWIVDKGKGNDTKGGWLKEKGNDTKGGWIVDKGKGKGNDTKGGWGIAKGNDSRGGWGITKGNDTQGGWIIEKGNDTKGGWIVDKGKGNDTKGGWTDEQIKIYPLTPGGNFKNVPTLFKWMREPNTTAYEFRLYDTDHTMLFSKYIMDTTLLVDFEALKIVPEKTYYWQVLAANGTKNVSRPAAFQTMNKEEIELIMDALTNSSLYNKANDELKSIIQAANLEKYNYFNETVNLYDNLSAKYPKNRLVKIAHAGFCARMGQSGKAAMLLK